MQGRLSRTVRRTIRHAAAIFGLTRKDFEKKGRAYFGDAGLAALSEEFSKKDLEIELLVVGFDETNNLLLFEVSGRGEVLGQHGFDFRTIGSGRDAVLGFLNPLVGFCDGRDLHQIVYTLCSAKFIAESADGVGHKTMVLCVDEHGDAKFMGGRDAETLRMLWDHEGPPPCPDIARELIKSSLLSYSERISQMAVASLEAQARDKD